MHAPPASPESASDVEDMSSVKRDIFGAGAAAGSTTPPEPTLFPPSSFLGDTFQGTQSTEIRCSVCGSISSRLEKFWSLSLSLASYKGTNAPSCVRRSERSARRSRSSRGKASKAEATASDAGPTPSLLDLLKETTATESLERENRYFCDKCNCKCEAERKTRLHHVPEVLVVRTCAFPQSILLLLHACIRASCVRSCEINQWRSTGACSFSYFIDPRTRRFILIEPFGLLMVENTRSRHMCSFRWMALIFPISAQRKHRRLLVGEGFHIHSRPW